MSDIHPHSAGNYFPPQLGIPSNLALFEKGLARRNPLARFQCLDLSLFWIGDFPRAGPAETGPEAGTIRLNLYDEARIILTGFAFGL
jgi:hypothetical protein